MLWAKPIRQTCFWMFLVHFQNIKLETLGGSSGLNHLRCIKKWKNGPDILGVGTTMLLLQASVGEYLPFFGNTHHT